MIGLFPVTRSLMWMVLCLNVMSTVKEEMNCHLTCDIFPPTLWDFIKNEKLNFQYTQNASWHEISIVSSFISCCLTCEKITYEFTFKLKKLGVFPFILNFILRSWDETWVSFGKLINNVSKQTILQAYLAPLRTVCPLLESQWHKNRRIALYKVIMCMTMTTRIDAKIIKKIYWNK